MSAYGLNMLVSVKPAAVGAIPVWNSTTLLWNPLEKGAARQVLQVNAGGTAIAYASLDHGADLAGRDAADSHPASAITFTPAGNIAATNVQAAIAELDSEKSGTGHDHSGTYQPLNSLLTDFGNLGGSIVAGDLFVGAGANDISRLPKGADTYVLTMVAGAVAWAAPGGGGGPWTDGTGITYLTDTAEDLAVGGSTLTGSPFAVDVSAGAVYGGLTTSAGFKFYSRCAATYAYTGAFQFDTTGSIQDMYLMVLKHNGTSVIQLGYTGSPYTGDITFPGGSGRVGCGYAGYVSGVTGAGGWNQGFARWANNNNYPVLWAEESSATVGCKIDLGVEAGRMLALNCVIPTTINGTSNAYNTAGNTGFWKSSASGGYIGIKYDNTEIAQITGSSFGIDNSLSFEVFVVLGAANPTSRLGDALLAFGSGGTSALDVGLKRDAAGVLAVTDGSTGTGTFKVLNTKYQTLTDAATIAVNAALGNHFKVTLGGNRMLGNPSNSPSGVAQTISFKIKQDATGSRLLTFDSSYRFGTDIAAVVLSTAANAVDYLTVIYDPDDAKWDVVSFIKGF